MKIENDVHFDEFEFLGGIVLAILSAAILGFLIGVHWESSKKEAPVALKAGDEQRIAIEYMRNASWRHTLCDAKNFPMDEDKETRK